MMKLPDKTIASCGDVSCELLVDPIPRPRAEPFTVTMRPEKDEVIFVDHGKPNSGEILRRAQRILRSRGVAVMDEILMKPTAAVPMPEKMLEKLSGMGGLILCGVSD
jgi:hypothetical protein